MAANEYAEVDVSDWELLEIEPMGSKPNKEWLFQPRGTEPRADTQARWLFKPRTRQRHRSVTFPKGDDWAEKVAGEIARVLAILRRSSNWHDAGASSASSPRTSQPAGTWFLATSRSPSATRAIRSTNGTASPDTRVRPSSTRYAGWTRYLRSGHRLAKACARPSLATSCSTP